RWWVRFDLGRTHVSLSLFDEEREQRFLLDGTSLLDIDQAGATIVASRRLGARIGLRAGATAVRRHYEMSDSDLARLTFGVDYEIGSRTDLTLDFRRSTPEPGSSDSFRREYTVRTVSLLLTHDF